MSTETEEGALASVTVLPLSCIRVFITSKGFVRTFATPLAVPDTSNSEEVLDQEEEEEDFVEDAID
jgi:hypothetical protein